VSMNWRPFRPSTTPLHSRPLIPISSLSSTFRYGVPTRSRLVQRRRFSVYGLHWTPSTGGGRAHSPAAFNYTCPWRQSATTREVPVRDLRVRAGWRANHQSFETFPLTLVAPFGSDKNLY
jgi:hypothetical protein